MKILGRTLAIIAFLTLTAQTVRHAYLLWLEPRDSALDKYDRPLKGEILKARSLDELLRRYEPVRKEADRVKQQQRDADRRPLEAQDDVEPFRSERALRAAIEDWESKSKEVHAVRFYWSAGFLLFALGVVAFTRVNRWLGLSLQIAAFSEFIYWTSPTFLGAAAREFDRLLVCKLALSVVSLLALAVAIRAQRLFSDDVQAGRNG